jgi:anti-sigma regulatory factor (Ser/Thr protein kinase)
MNPTITGRGEERLVLHVQLSEIARVADWVERLASQYAIAESTQFAINLCLEEVLSNIILHGLKGHHGRTVVLHFSATQKGRFLFVVEDDAPRFNPLEQQPLPALSPNQEIRIGGQGLRLLQEFADTLEYEPTPTGNRLKIGFSTPDSHELAEKSGT